MVYHPCMLSDFPHNTIPLMKSFLTPGHCPQRQMKKERKDDSGKVYLNSFRVLLLYINFLLTQTGSVFTKLRPAHLF